MDSFWDALRALVAGKVLILFGIWISFTGVAIYYLVTVYMYDGKYHGTLIHSDRVYVGGFWYVKEIFQKDDTNNTCYVTRQTPYVTVHEVNRMKDKVILGTNRTIWSYWGKNGVCFDRSIKGYYEDVGFAMVSGFIAVPFSLVAFACLTAREMKRIRRAERERATILFNNLIQEIEESRNRKTVVNNPPIDELFDLEANCIDYDPEILVLNIDQEEENLLQTHSNWLLPYQTVRLNDLIIDINRCFIVAIRSRMESEGKRTVNSTSPLPLAQTDKDFLRGCLLSMLLKTALGNDFQRINDPSVYVTLSNALAMHASLKMNVDMRTISLNYSHRIAYQIGTTIYTYFDLTNTCLVRTDQITLTL